jgi:hypothetical protein
MANKKASADTVRTGIEEITTQGDLLYRGATDLKHLPKGSSGQQLSMGNSNEPEWITVADELPAAGTSGNVLTSTGSAWASSTPAGGGFTQATEQATTSGTAFTFSGIPAGTTMIVIMFDEIGMASSDRMSVRIGDSGGIETSGYVASSIAVKYNEATRRDNVADGWCLMRILSGNVVSGHMTLTRKDSASFNWISSHNVKLDGDSASIGSGSKHLSAELTQLQIFGGTFNAGSINVIYQ